MDASLGWIAAIPREEIPWYPALDSEACMGNRDCIAFCPQEVFQWDAEAGRAVVADPFKCVVGCSDCAHVCPSLAISFQSAEEWLARRRQWTH
jgi:NAD-dependent dihydropyrimidine dehydrogenase PreA subunit